MTDLYVISFKNEGDIEQFKDLFSSCKKITLCKNCCFSYEAIGNVRYQHGLVCAKDGLNVRECDFCSSPGDEVF